MRLSNFALASFALLAASISPLLHAGEDDVFLRLLTRLTAQESMTVERYLMVSSPELREFSRSVLGADAVGIPDELLTRRAIEFLQGRGDYRLATELESRLNGVRDEFVTEMSANPASDMDALLGKLSAETFQSNKLPDGRVRFAKRAPLSTSERALAEALHADPELGTLRKAVQQAAQSSPDLQLNEALTTYDRLIKDAPQLEKLFSKASVYRQLADEEMTGFTDNLKSVMKGIETAPAAMSPEQKTRYALRKMLHNQVPNSSIAERVRAFMAGEPGSFRRVLGDMTLEETQELFHGGDPLHPSPDSLLGQYLKETGAATLVRSFDDYALQEAGQPGTQGPQKLVVSLSEQSFPAFIKLFKNKDWMSIVGHAYMVHDGQVMTYSGQVMDFRPPHSEYTPYPMLLLKSTEGQRAAQYFRLFRTVPMQGFDSDAASPWNLRGYCARSAWGGGCTQHVGNMPIGDERMLEYTMPGNQAVPDFFNPQTAIQRLKPYESDNPLVRRVWKVPGNQQLGELIGQQGANLRGELANPGWLIWTLLGPTSAERVPIVFVSRVDHKLPIDPAFVPNVEVRR